MKLSKFWIVAIVSIAIYATAIKSAEAQCGGSDVKVSSASNCLPVLSTFVVSPAFAKGSLYYWDIGDGNGGVLGSDTFYHQYSKSGTYGITVTVLKPDGTKCTISKPKGFLSFSAPLNPGFYATQTLYCSLPALISLHDTTKNSVTRDWYINGTLISSHGPNIQVSDTVTGEAQISLVVYNSSGCPQTISKMNYINVIEDIPVSFCSMLTENVKTSQISAQFQIGFDTTGYHISEIDWSFPSGSPSTYKGLRPPAIIYSNLISFQDVTLTVKTVSGCTQSATKKALVGQYFSVKQVICENVWDTLHFLGIYPFPINKGFVSSLTPFSFQSYKNSVAMKFSSPGSATIKFVIQQYGCDSLVVPNLITVLPPLADYSFKINNPCSNSPTVFLHSLSGNPSTGSNSYTWQILDSSKTQLSGSPIGPSSKTDTSFTFSKLGIYSIRLIAANTDGCSDTALKSNVIRVGTPDINYKFVHDTLCAGDTLYIVNNTKMKNYPGNQISFYWYFTDNNAPSVSLGYSGRSPKIKFIVPGTYSLSYSVSQPACTSSQFIKNAVFVNGVSGILNMTGSSNCTPVTYNLSATITSNVPANSPLSYFWSVSPSSGAILSNTAAASPTITFSKPGYYNVSAIISNGVCSSEISKDSILIGTAPDFSIDSFSCLNNSVYPKNKSSANVSAFKWSVSPSSGVSISNDTARTPAFIFTEQGCYTVYLQTSDSNLPNCLDTITKRICIHQPPIVTSVLSPDTTGHCTPRVDTFYAKSINGKSFYWNFGDNNSVLTNDSQITHAYFNNNAAGFTVKVVAKDSNGCSSDTFSLKNYIKISGPEPSFTMNPTALCDSGTVSFTNTSNYVYQYYFIYGDISKIDSNEINPHLYQYEDYSKDSNIYKPTLFAFDETGCIASYALDLKLYRPPIVSVFALDSNGCLPYSVQFLDSTKYAAKYHWDFGDGNSDTTFAPQHIYNQVLPNNVPYGATLTAISDKGCSVTSSPLHIFVHPIPNPVIQYSGLKLLCYPDTAHFKGISDIAARRYHWNFGDGNLVSDTSSLQNPDYHYIYPGKHNVSLTVYSDYGCSHTITDSALLQSLDSLSPIPPQVDFVTVTPLNQIQIVFSKSRSPKFSSYVLYRYPGLDSIFSSSNLDDTVYFDSPPMVDVNSASYAYTLKMTDVCGFTSSYTIPQHSIFLSVSKYMNNALELTWNKYTGWPGVQSYQVYRLDTKGKFYLLATVPALDSTYIDSNLCPDRYIYYVNAVNTNGIYNSTSDTASGTPDYLFQSVPLDLAKATVINNKSVLVTWNASVQGNVKYYTVDRYTETSGWIYNYALSNTTSFIDPAVSVNKESYIYRVSVIDECGNQSTISNVGTSILLRGYVVNDVRYLNWNTYSFWKRGVASYHLQMEQNDGSFKDIAALPQNDSAYIDTAAHADLDIETCYRIYAVENPDLNGNIDSSLSNIACPFLLPRIFVPNAFSPNNDSINDVFIPKGLSIIVNTDVKAQRYDFRIYNKWGELLFETSDFRKGWDGKYKGVFVPSDVYIYVLDAQGFNGQRYYLKGNVTVVK